MALTQGSVAVELRQRLFDVHDLWELGLQDEHKDKDCELIDGAIIETTKPGGRHGKLAIGLGPYLDVLVKDSRLGHGTSETGYFLADDRLTMLAPDLAFISHDKAPVPFPENWIPAMPDLAFEIRSPSNTDQELRETAQTHLRRGIALVRMLLPAAQRVEVWRMAQDGSFASSLLQQPDSLTGEDVLPGFELGLKVPFARI